MVVAKALYLASNEDLDIMLCLFDFQEIKDVPKKT